MLDSTEQFQPAILRERVNLYWCQAIIELLKSDVNPLKPGILAGGASVENTENPYSQLFSRVSARQTQQIQPESS
jgi:hypothetical protein